MYSKSMKRDREQSPITKRSRSTLGRYDDHSDGDSGRVRSRSPVGRRYEEYRDRSHSSTHHTSSTYKDRGSERPYPYKVLCISSLHTKASDEVVRESLYREFKRFGDISVKIVNEPDERVAYVYFRSSEEAREAKYTKNRIFIYDKAVMVEPAYESTSASSSTSSTSSYRETYRSRDAGYGDRSHGPRDERYDHRHHPPPKQPAPAFFGHHGEYRREPHPYHAPPPPHHHPQNYMRPPAPFNPRFGHSAGGSSRGYPPMGPSGPPMDRPPSAESKKDKFPNYLQHIAPEDDPLATRTLFAGNLEVNITDDELRRIFARFGQVEDIDIKRPPPGTGNAYAFVRFANLDMAARAKSELSGQYIGKFQVKIGYGKANPTTKVWVGGLGPWTSLQALEREFDRFGSIRKIDWVKGEAEAFIAYETLDAAQAAVKDMRGYPLGGTDQRIRTDFADSSVTLGPQPFPPPNKKFDDPTAQDFGRTNYHKSNTYRANVEIRTDGTPSGTIPVKKEHSDPATPEKAEEVNKNGVELSIASLAKMSGIVWNGALTLKNSSFPAEMFMLEGVFDDFEALMKDEDGKFALKITQRLRLEEAKLDDVLRRMGNCSAYGVLIAQSPSGPPIASPEAVKTHPLKNLISYLKSKEAAGVISHANRTDGSAGVLYAFPPCSFAKNFLTKAAPSLDADKEPNYLLIIVIRGGTA